MKELREDGIQKRSTTSPLPFHKNMLAASTLSLREDMDGVVFFFFFFFFFFFCSESVCVREK